MRRICLNCIHLEGVELADHPVPVIKCPEGIREYDLPPCERFSSGLHEVGG